MTRKDYIRIARALNTLHNSDRGHPFDTDASNEEMIESVALFIANELGEDNPRFDRDHFLSVVRGEKALESRPPRRSPKEES